MRRPIALLACFLATAQAAETDVPFVVTPDSVTIAMLQLANVKQDDYVIDLGSGDGRIVILAAKKFGARGLGVEINPELVQKSRANAAAAGVASRAIFRELDLFKTDLSPASVITMYLLPDVNLQLRPRLLTLRPGTRVVSHDFDMGDWQPDKTLKVAAPDKPIGLDKTSRLYLWIVPAKVEGTWCGAGKQRGATLKIAQQYQRFRGELDKGEAPLAFEGKIDGSALRSPRNVNLRLEGDRLKVQAVAKAYSPYHGGAFTRAGRQGCR
jgi:SAM-dependent methyltransferase